MLQQTLPLCTLAVLSTLAIAPINADDPSREEQLTVVVYPVADLPLYRQNSDQMQPHVLVALIKSLCPGFDEQGSQIATHETTLSLVVRTTRANHKRISIGLESLRESMKGDDIQKQVGRGAATTSELQQSRRIMLAPDPVLEQIKQLPHKQPRYVPHVWPTWSETEIPDDRDFMFGGVPLTR